MDRLKRDAILIRLVEALRKRGSWCGATHLQKATFFLQEMLGVEMGFDFTLYKHGPFSFDFSDELTAMRADGFVALRVQNPDYGPSIVPEPAAETLCQRFPKTLKRHEALIKFVADKLGNKPVVELERLATAFYVSQALGAETDANTCAKQIHKLKPHISVDQAIEAIRMVEVWREKASKLQGDIGTTKSNDAAGAGRKPKSRR